MTPAILDIAALTASAPSDKVRRLMRAGFERQLPEILSSFDAAEDAWAWQECVHKLRGACSAMGARRVGAFLLEVEHSPLAAQADWRDRQRRQLVLHLDDLLHEMRARIP